MREVDMRSFAAAHAAGATVIDVREPFEYLAGHVPGARSIPLRELSERVDGLPRSAPVYVVCASGMRSLAAANALAQIGVDAYSVTGGTNAWADEGRRVVRGPDKG